MLEGPITKLKLCGNLIPAPLLPEKENETPDPDCSLFLTLNYALQEDMIDDPLDNPDMKIFTDSGSFVLDRNHKSYYAMVMAGEILETESLSLGMSAKLAELVVLT